MDSNCGGIWRYFCGVEWAQATNLKTKVGCRLTGVELVQENENLVRKAAGSGKNWKIIQQEYEVAQRSRGETGG